MDHKIISEALNEIIISAGKVIGIPLAMRMIMDPMERIRSMYSEINTLEILKDSVKIGLKKGVSDKVVVEILSVSAMEIERSYSSVIGSVSKTIVRDSINNIAKKYGKKYPELNKLSKLL